MILIDVNVLLYVVNESAPQHPKVLAWWEALVRSGRPIAIPWTVLIGFVRMSTHPRIMESPLGVDEALSHVHEWLSLPTVLVPNPGPQHWLLLCDLLKEVGGAGNLTTDAHLAAIAIEAGASLASCDTDFVRFGKLRWENPLALA